MIVFAQGCCVLYRAAHTLVPAPRYLRDMTLRKDALARRQEGGGVGAVGFALGDLIRCKGAMTAYVGGVVPPVMGRRHCNVPTVPDYVYDFRTGTEDANVLDSIRRLERALVPYDLLCPSASSCPFEPLHHGTAHKGAKHARQPFVRSLTRPRASREPRLHLFGARERPQ